MSLSNNQPDALISLNMFIYFPLSTCFERSSSGETKIVITQLLALVTPCLLQRLTVVESKPVHFQPPSARSCVVTILVSPDDERSKHVESGK
jgi:hypothetical protein